MKLSTNFARAQTASSKARNTEIKQIAEIKKKRTQPPASATKKAKEEKQAYKILTVEQEKTKDHALY